MHKNEPDTGHLRKILKNFVWLFLQLGITRSFGFLFTIILARNLLQAEFGRYTYAIGVAGIFLIISDMGLMSLGLREIARHRENASAIFSRLIRVKIPLALLVYCIFLAFQLLTPASGGHLPVVLLTTAFFFENMGTFMVMPFKATEQMQYAAIGDFIYKGLLIGGVLVMFLLKQGFLQVTCIYLGSAIFYFCLYTVLYRTKFGFTGRTRSVSAFLSNFTQEIRASAPIAFGGLIMVVYINADVIMLKWLKGEVITGLYGVSYSFYLGLALAASILVQSVVPRLSRSFEQGDEGTRATVLKGTVKLLFLLSVPLACGGVLLSAEIITFFYGARYLGSEGAFRIFMVTVLFNYINLLMCYYLFTQRRQKEINAMYLITISANVILNLLLIPRWSLDGAAFATMTAEVAFAVIFLIRHPQFRSYFAFSWIWRLTIAVAAMCGVLLLINGRGGFIVSLLCGAGVYGAVIGALGTLKNEKDLLQGVFKKVASTPDAPAIGA